MRKSLSLRAALLAGAATLGLATSAQAALEIFDINQTATPGNPVGIDVNRDRTMDLWFMVRQNEGGETGLVTNQSPLLMDVRLERTELVIIDQPRTVTQVFAQPNSISYTGGFVQRLDAPAPGGMPVEVNASTGVLVDEADLYRTETLILGRTAEPMPMEAPAVGPFAVKGDVAYIGFAIQEMGIHFGGRNGRIGDYNELQVLEIDQPMRVVDEVYEEIQPVINYGWIEVSRSSVRVQRVAIQRTANTPAPIPGTVPSVSEPGSLALAGLGLAGLVAARRRRQS